MNELGVLLPVDFVSPTRFRDFCHLSPGSHAFRAGPRGGSLIAPDSGPQDPRPPACPPLYTLQSRGPASSENKKGPFKPPTLCLSASGVGRHRAGFARSILGPSPCGVRWDPPCGLRRPPGASSSGRSLRGERDHTEVRRTEPRVDAEPGPATARVPSRSPLAPSEAASDTSGMSRGKMTLDRGFGPRAPVPAPPPTAGHGPSRRLRTLVGEMPELGAGQLTALGKRSDSYICARKGGTCNLSPCPLYNRIEGTCYKGKAKCCIR
ncbi:beta-defensin 1 [Ovis canadensis]|uniref:beta-defensin 1 n=1 Tax=Ovis canadensis TaxID=37174 RepID=UPI0037512147